MLQQPPNSSAIPALNASTAVNPPILVWFPPCWLVVSASSTVLAFLSFLGTQRRRLSNLPATNLLAAWMLHFKSMCRNSAPQSRRWHILLKHTTLFHTASAPPSPYSVTVRWISLFDGRSQSRQFQRCSLVSACYQHGLVKVFATVHQIFTMTDQIKYRGRVTVVSAWLALQSKQRFHLSCALHSAYRIDNPEALIPW